MSVYILVLSGGVGSRMRSQLPKQFLPLEDKPILSHSVQRFLSWDSLDRMVVVSSEDYLEETRAILHESHPKLRFAIGGKERHDSFLKGMESLPLVDGDTVLIHDAARPFFDLQECEALVESSQKHGAATFVRNVTETLIQGKETETGLSFDKVLPREKVMVVLTPQAIQAEIYKEALQREAKLKKDGAELPQVTDLCSWLQPLGLDTAFCFSNIWNLKITNPMDLELAKSIYRTL